MKISFEDRDDFCVIIVSEGPFKTNEYYFADATKMALSDGTLLDCRPERSGFMVEHKGGALQEISAKDKKILSITFNKEKIDWFIFGDKSDVFSPIRI